MALINKHFEEVLGDIGVIKLWTTKFLGIPIYKKESLSERMTEINAFQAVGRNAVGFRTSDEKDNEDNEDKDKSEDTVREVQARAIEKWRLDRFKGKRKSLFTFSKSCRGRSNTV